MPSAKNAAQQAHQHYGDETRIPEQLGTYIACLIIAYTAVILRFVSRRIKRTQLKADDWLIVVSLFFTTAFTGINISLMRDGLGRHENHITNAKFFALGILIGEIMYSLAIFMVKLSLLFLLHRLFPKISKKRLHYTLWVTGVIISAYTVVQIVCVVLLCVPFKALWDPSVTAYCIRLDIVVLVCGSLNIATDVVILILPVPEIWNLQIAMRQKLQLTFLFLLGGLVCIFSLIRITKLPQISLTDPGWSSVSSVIWSVVECSVATLSACLPTMRPLYHRLSSGRNTETSNKTPKIQAGHTTSLSARRKPTTFHEATYDDTWPLKTPANVSEVHASLEMNPVHQT